MASTGSTLEPIPSPAPRLLWVAYCPERLKARMIERAMLIDRWYELTRRVLPGMAAQQGWPIERDHCFMRVCLDEAVGAPWTTVVKRPAVHAMTPDQLAAAVAVAEMIVVRPDMLVPLNERSLRGRRDARRREALPPAS